MILGIGIDSIDIRRFAQWHRFSYQQLTRIFSPQEISYCLSESCTSAQRFAVRFAAREALLKALNHGVLPGVPLLAVCKAVSIAHNKHNAPIMQINWNVLTGPLSTTPISTISPLISLTHSDSIATAIVLLQRSHHDID